MANEVLSRIQSESVARVVPLFSCFSTRENIESNTKTWYPNRVHNFQLGHALRMQITHEFGLSAALYSISSPASRTSIIVIILNPIFSLLNLYAEWIGFFKTPGKEKKKKLKSQISVLDDIRNPPPYYFQDSCSLGSSFYKNRILICTYRAYHLCKCNRTQITPPSPWSYLSFRFLLSSALVWCNHKKI